MVQIHKCVVNKSFRNIDGKTSFTGEAHVFGKADWKSVVLTNYSAIVFLLGKRVGILKRDVEDIQMMWGITATSGNTLSLYVGISRSFRT